MSHATGRFVRMIYMRVERWKQAWGWASISLVRPALPCCPLTLRTAHTPNIRHKPSVNQLC